jgi:CHASE2 domain-containing sensor protein
VTRAPSGGRRRRQGARVLACLAAGAVALAGVLAAQLAGAFHRAEDASVDLRFELRGASRPSDLLVVAIDDVTFSDLARQWPFPRSLHARAIDRLRADGARRIVYDVQFTEPTTPREDLALYRAVARARNVVLATTEVDDHGRTNVLGGDANLARAGAWAAASNLPTSAGGVIRRVRLSVSGLETVAARTAELTTGRPPAEGAFAGGGALIDYRGPPGTIPTVSFSDLVRGRVSPRLVRGRVVVIGASAPTLQDVHPTPTAADRTMSGPEVQANAIWTAMHGVPLREAPAWLGLLAAALLGLVAPLATLRLRALPAAALAVAGGLAYAGVAVLAFDRGTVLAVVAPLAACAAGTVAALVTGYVAEARERRRVSGHAEVLERMVRERTADLRATQLEVIHRLAGAAESRDEDTGEHIERMSRMCEALGLAAGMSEAEAEELQHAAVLHDVGKIGIPDRVLLKPGRLDAEELAVMRRHTTIGGDILAGSRSPLVRMAETIARTHHERWDGSGYPAGLRGEAIPLAGRIAAICDVFDALLAPRPYKERWTLERTLEEMERLRGTHFDPALLDLFLPLAPLLAERFHLVAEPAVVPG